jgi:hypothetical protein
MVDAPMFADREHAGPFNEIRHAAAVVKFAAQASGCSGEVETGSPTRTCARKAETCGGWKTPPRDAKTRGCRVRGRLQGET